jgi:hypothetical protein
MSTAVAEGNFLATSNILSRALPFPLPQIEAGLKLCFDIPTFNSQLAVSITDVDSDMKSGKVVFKAEAYDIVMMLTAAGELTEDGFKIGNVNFHMERAKENARADFIISTIRSALVLADDVYLRIPDIQVDITLRFEESLLEISQMLRRRQIDYRIMVIEHVTGREFHLPVDISGDEVRDITLAYRAIVERSFAWPIDSITVYFPATKEWSDTLVRLRQETSIPIGPDPVSLNLFGQTFELGQRGIVIKDAVIEDFDAVHKELNKDDGHLVPIIIRSASGQARYDFFGAPEQPPVLWDLNIQKMIELEPQLDARLAERYNALAAATLAGLTEEEKEEVTSRPELGEAFLINNSDGE